MVIQVRQQLLGQHPDVVARLLSRHLLLRGLRNRGHEDDDQRGHVLADQVIQRIGQVALGQPFATLADDDQRVAFAATLIARG